MNGDGYALATLDEMGEGPGFRKVRKELGVTAFGANVIIVPKGYGGNFHYHEEQEELYFVHQGRVEFEFGDGTKHEVGPGGFVRVDPETRRKYTSVGDDELVMFIVGGKDGYVGRDGRTDDEDAPRVTSG
jgi:mannose-6-phosphate isomerase-like protein (cupin superfamily)